VTSIQHEAFNLAVDYAGDRVAKIHLVFPFLGNGKGSRGNITSSIYQVSGNLATGDRDHVNLDPGVPGPRCKAFVYACLETEKNSAAIPPGLPFLRKQDVSVGTTGIRISPRSSISSRSPVQGDWMKSTRLFSALYSGASSVD
jgi:hypothetical protein